MVKKHEKSSSPTTKEKNNKQKKTLPYSLIVGVLLVIAVIVAATLFFNNQQKSTPVDDYSTYNNFKFTKLQVGWQTSVQKDDQLYDVPFYNHPRDIVNVSYDNNVTRIMEKVIQTVSPPRKFIIAIHPDAGSVPVLAGINVAKITGKFYGRETISALYMERDEFLKRQNETDIPVTNCAKASFSNVIIKMSANETENSVRFLDNYCILIGGKDKDGLFMAADLLGYKLLGIVR